MESVLVSALVVAAAEIGDKTQLLALVLATRFRKPLPIILAIFVATLANHAGAAAIGGVIAAWIGPQILRWILAVSFVAMGAWILVPDKIDDDPAASFGNHGVFLTTLISFFLVEIGDKTQIATIAMAAKYHSIVWVSVGTTMGMMAANVPAVLLGDIAAKKLPLRLIRAIAALIFILLGILVFLKDPAEMLSSL